MDTSSTVIMDILVVQKQSTVHFLLGVMDTSRAAKQQFQVRLVSIVTPLDHV